ncbi:uncharacterized protein LOC131246521 [Magnolia sinica]|uniref:uncharacterized protein LOC131246521 n=1 Tax=Magnolia sinica TaxID=86752 RepID=UPI00265B0175|nr:uncharacterized protein LOC131246521 [Magnolia sinica]
MEVHSRVNSHVAKRLWNFIRIAYFMMRKGLVSKRKIIIDMNLMMKRGKVVGKSLGNLMFHHNHPRSGPRGFGVQDYEFSCSNSPNPVFFHVGKRKHHHHYFPSIPCIKGPDEPEESDEPKAVIMLPNIDYSPDYSYNLQTDVPDLAVGEKLSPMVSPFSVRVSNYSSDDENDSGARQVDREAEEFIRSFYEQLRVQSRTALLQYQERQYQEMLARGTH